MFGHTLTIIVTDFQHLLFFITQLTHQRFFVFGLEGCIIGVVERVFCHLELFIAEFDTVVLEA